MLLQATLDNDDSQDSNNSMVDDLVAKVLNDDCITGNELFANHCNGDMNSEKHQNRAPVAQNYRRNPGNNAYLADTSELYTTCALTQVSNSTLDECQNDQVSRNIFGGLNSLGLNLCIGQQSHNNTAPYTNAYISDLQSHR